MAVSCFPGAVHKVILPLKGPARSAVWEMSGKTMRRKYCPFSATNFGLILFAAVFFALTMLSGIDEKDDYAGYLIQWTDVLIGRDPWQLGRMDPGVPYNAYGPVFNLLGPLSLIHPLFNKLLFSSTHIGFVVWLAKVRGLTISSPVLLFVLLNPLPWAIVARDGLFDGTVGIACVMAVYCIEQGKERRAGAWLAAGALLKFSPLLVFPFLAFNSQCFRVRFLIWGTILIVGGMGLSVLAWGPSTFNALIFAGTRGPSDHSIYAEFNSAMRYVDRMDLPIRFAWESVNIDQLTGRLSMLSLPIAGLGMFAWCAVFRPSPALATFMAILTTLTFYRIGFVQYQMMLFCIASYWAASEWQEIKGCPTLVSLLIGYFSIVGIIAQGGLLLAEFNGRDFFVLYGLQYAFAIAILLSLMRFTALNRFESSRPVSTA
jgi:hypothetical protein